MTAPAGRGPAGDDSEPWHGTTGGYRNHACGCDRCRAAQADALRDWRGRRRAAVVRSRGLPPEADWLTHETIRCLECGLWKKALGRHLNAAHGMTADEYRAAWGMRQRQALAAGYLSDWRREIAVERGGVERMRALASRSAPLAAQARAGRERRPQEIRSLRAGQQRWWDRSRADADTRATASAQALGYPDVGAYLHARYISDLQPIRVLCAELGVNKQVVVRLMSWSGIGVRGPGPTRAQ